jgi:integrase
LGGDEEGREGTMRSRKIRCHDLRHTCATLLLSKHVNPEMLRYGPSSEGRCPYQGKG